MSAALPASRGPAIDLRRRLRRPDDALGRALIGTVPILWKNVDLAELRLGSADLAGFGDAIRERLFTELGSGELDLVGCLRALADREYAGWLMVEQDSSWSPPSEAAAIGRRVLAATIAAIRER